ncbi:glycosyltransferase family 2 protein [Hymenobacter sp. BT683]|uniref:Glycosyltransferase family 2 protein n=1 Tax=Hymenobacter jeongseonensis TaxID=2791027 RepID=A0ABS0IDX6_9BACT|nr:glycosyltransferase family 2 protein [Hymenobacter jeongseonensis]MBF9236254.1 glycosyltransferase family 2 protein [Hymenobacter jeongseonensis]
MLHIVIPVFNRLHFTRACLQSLRRQTHQAFRVIVVDDGSTDGTSEHLAQEFAEVEVLRSSGDLFWTATVNLGIRRALALGADRVMTLNNDVVAPPDFVEHMLLWSQRQPRALMGPLELDAATGKPVFGGELFSFLTHRTRSLLDILGPDQRTGLHPVTFLPGRGLLVPAEVFHTVGLFDEGRLPHYLADYDFTSQARRQGFPVYVNYATHLLTYPDESGQTQTRRHRSFRGYYQHLFGIRGGGNLANFSHFAIKNAPATYLPLFLLNGYVRRLVGYFLH